MRAGGSVNLEKLQEMLTDAFNDAAVSARLKEPAGPEYQPKDAGKG